jgi:murein DD-endopeptidase MepM/ murein hydrolase activator NlpD
LENIQAIPGKFLAIQTNLNKLQTVIKNAKVRHFWWLNLKLELKQQITKIYNQLELAFGVLKKLYLLVLIVVSFSSLAFIGNANFVNSSASFSAKVISNYTKPETVKYNITSTIGLTPINQLKQQGTSDNLFLSRVSEYKVESGDTLDKIAEMHGISVEAITFNNQIKAEDATLPTTLYLPFSDSYIYKATKDTKIDDLARIYGLSKQAIYLVNETTLNQETQSFPTGSLVVIPISNFNEVAQKNSTESARISDEENKSKAYTYNTATTTVNSTKYAESTSDQRSAGLIFPTVWGGTITSRCIQPGHIACDFANRSEPPIFAAQNGKVVTKAYEAYGYGNYVVIDHGNGIKTLYAHMQAVYVTLGQDVTQGQSIGQMGCVGACTGTHVHFEVILNGVKQNPVNYLEKIP